MNKYLILIVFPVLMMGGCAVFAPRPELVGTFVLSGKVAVQEGDRRFSGNLRWHQQPDGFDIVLWGPLGQGRVHLEGHNGLVRLTSNAGTIAEGEAEQVMREQLGWSIPLSTLPAWVQGRPVSGRPVAGLVRDAEGRIAGFEQLGWRVSLSRYQPVPPGNVPRPTRITLSRADTHVRLVIKRWWLNDASSEEAG